jgi:hypothetical protein
MKQEKIIPSGAEAEAVDKTGVHRKTKMYMQLSTMLCDHGWKWTELRLIYTSDFKARFRIKLAHFRE